MKAADYACQESAVIPPDQVIPAITEEADDMFRTSDVATFTVAHGAHDMYTSFVPPLLPVLIETLSLTNTQAGMLPVFMRLPALSQPFIGLLSDRKDLRYLVILTPAVTGTLMTLIGYMPTFWTVALLLALVGFSSACLHAVAPAVAVKVSGKDLGKGMSLWMVGGELGWTLGPIICVTVVGLYTIKGLPILATIGWAASLFLFIRLRKFKDTKSVVVRTLPIGAILSEMKSIMLVILAILFLSSFLNSALGTFLPVFLTQKGVGLWLAGVSVTIVQASGAVGTLIGGSLSDRIGRRVVALFCLVVPPLLMVLFLNAEGWVVFLLLLLMGFSAFAINPVFMALVLDSFPENRALANGIYLTMNFVISAVALLLMGFAADKIGYESAYLASAFLTLLAVPFVFLLPRGKISGKAGSKQV